MVAVGWVPQPGRGAQDPWNLSAQNRLGPDLGVGRVLPLPGFLFLVVRKHRKSIAWCVTDRALSLSVLHQRALSVGTRPCPLCF